MKRLIISSTAIITLSVLSSFAMLGNWENLGARKVNYGVERDEIAVTAWKGTYRALRLKVEGAPIRLISATIHYGNGTKQKLVINKRIPANSFTRAFDLPGRKRIVKRVSFVYKTVPKAPKRATIRLQGRD